MRLTRRRRFLSVLGVFAAGMAVLALVDRKAAYVILYAIGAILFLLGSAAGMGGGVTGPILGGEADAARVYRRDMDQRMAWLSQNLLLLLAGAVFIALAVLLQLA